MSDDIREFLDHLLTERELTDNTIAAYAKNLEDLRGYLEPLGITWSVVTAHIIQGYLATRSRDGLRRSTLNQRLASFKTFFQWMTQTRRIPLNPALPIARTRDRRGEPDALTAAEVEQLLNQPTMPVRERAVLETLYSAGLRVSELISLKVADVNLQEGHLRLTGKDGRERIIPLGETALQALEVYLVQMRPSLKARPGERSLFLNYAGRGLSRQCVWAMVKNAAHAARMPNTITPHTLRHSFAIHLLEKGVDVRSVQELLGHADVSSTKVYQHTARRRVREAVAA